MTTAKRSPFPLQWPESWPRTKWKNVPKFSEGHFSRVRDSVIRQLNKMGGSHIVITTDLPTRADGLPYANARCDEPGVAVYWIKNGHEQVIACDRWRNVNLNLRSIDMTLDAMRGIDRWGTATMVEKAFAGFAALPSGTGEEFVPPPAKARHWRDVLDMRGAMEQLSYADQRVIVKARHRELIKINHPDAGGDPARAAEINAALDAAETELGL